MLHPFDLVNVQAKARQKGYAPGSTAYINYIETLKIKAHNSFLVPSVFGYVILGVFAFIVLAVALVRVTPVLHIRSRLLSKHIVHSPLAHKRHAQPWGGQGVLSIRAPLRGHFILLIGLALLNILPLFAFYTIQEPAKNVNYPHGSFGQYSRYFADRAAVMALSQLPLLFLTSGRNNFVILLTDCDFQTSMLWHRWIARLTVLQALCHAIGYTANTLVARRATYFAYWHEVYFNFGVLAILFFCFLAFFAQRWIRAKAYEAFVVLHVIFALIATIALYYHIHLLESAAMNDFLFCIFISCGFWAFDRVVRVLRIVLLTFDIRSLRWSHAQVERVQDLDVVHISVQANGLLAHRLTSVGPGKHFNLLFPSIQTVAAHPFSLSHVRADDNGAVTLTFFALARKGITKKLLEWIEGKSCKVALEGPYGKKFDIDKHHDVLLMASGIGVTHCISYLTYAMTHMPHATSHLVWYIRSETFIGIIVEQLEHLAVAQEQIYKDRPRITLILSSPIANDTSPRSSVESSVIDSEKVPSYRSSRTLRQRLDDVRGAFSIDVIAGEMPKRTVDDVIRENATEQTAVVSCGSQTFLDDVRQATLHIGAMLYEEAFAW